VRCAKLDRHHPENISMRRLGILLLFTFIVSACGQKGALYPPKEKAKPELTEEGTVKERNGEK